MSTANGLQRPEPGPAAHAPRARLTVEGASPVRFCETTGLVTLIGSRRDVALSLPDPEVSKVHCALINTGRAVLVCDLGSRTGTFQNEKRIRVAALRSGDHLRIGPHRLRVDFPVPPPIVRGPRRQDGLRLHPSLSLTIHQRRTELTSNGALIGRRETCDVVLDTPDTSLAHALVFTVEGCPVICDLQSRSGVLLNGERVLLAWLHDNDRINIGGETLQVSWRGSIGGEAARTAPPEAAAPKRAPAPFPTEAPSAAPPSAPSPLGPLLNAAPGDLDEIEQTLQALQAQIAASAAALDARSDEVAQRQLGLEQQAAQLTQRAADLEAAEHGLHEREQALVEAQTQAQSAAATTAADLAAERAALDAAQLELSERRQQVRAAEVEAQTRQAYFAKEQARLEELARALEAQQTEVQTALTQAQAMQTQLDQRLATCDKREQALDARESALAEREALLRERESADAGSAARLEAIKASLRNATQKFATLTPAAPPPAEAQARAAGPAAPNPASTGSAAGAGGLPAPIVDQPLFSATDAASRKLLAEVQQTVRTARAFSQKSDAELIAESQAQRPAEPPVSAGDVKRKRRWWA